MTDLMVQPGSSVCRSVPVIETRAWRPSLRLVGLASITVTFLAASAAPTPLYATYQKAWGFSALTTTVIFGVYALAFLSALLTVGRLSDHVGRRPVLMVGIAGQILALVIFIDAHSVAALLAARIVQGLAAGSAIGAAGAGMLDIDQVRGAVANATAPGLGTGSGVLLSAFAVQWLPAPTRLVYFVLVGLLLVQAVGVFFLPETSLIDHLVGSASVVEGGLGLGILAGLAAFTTYALKTTQASRVMLIGTSTLALGVLAVLLSIRADSAPGFFAGTALAGIGFGAGFQGGIRLVAPLAHPDQRAGVLSVLFTVSYLGLGIPAVAAGLAVVRGSGLVTTSYEYCLAVIGLAIFASVNLIRLRQHDGPSIKEVSQ